MSEKLFKSLGITVGNGNEKSLLTTVENNEVSKSEGAIGAQSGRVGLRTALSVLDEQLSKGEAKETYDGALKDTHAQSWHKDAKKEKTVEEVEEVPELKEGKRQPLKPTSAVRVVNVKESEITGENEDAEKSELDELCDLIKGGKEGEGSRGGKIIGHTKGGNPIYEGQMKAAIKRHNENDFKNVADELAAKKEDHHLKLAEEVAHRKHSDKHGFAPSAVSKRQKIKMEDVKEHLRVHGGGKKEEESKGSIGKTKSGKDIVANPHEHNSKDWTSEDHSDAAEAHKKEAEKYKAGRDAYKKNKQTGNQEDYEKYNAHAYMADHHSNLKQADLFDGEKRQYHKNMADVAHKNAKYFSEGSKKDKENKLNDALSKIESQFGTKKSDGPTGKPSLKSLDNDIQDLMKGLFYEAKAALKSPEEYTPTKKDLLNRLNWKLRELKELKDIAWIVEQETPEAKEMAEKMYSSLKADIKKIIDDYKTAKKSETHFDDLFKAESEVEGNEVKMPKKEFIDEHKKLVSTLESESHEDDKKEAKEQKKELKEVQAKKSFGVDDCLEDLIKGGSKHIKMIKDQNDPKEIATIHENSPQLAEKGRFEEVTKEVQEKNKKKCHCGKNCECNKSDDAVGKKISKLVNEGEPQKQAVATALNMQREGRLTSEGGYKHAKKSFVKAMGPGGMIFDFGLMTGNPMADNATRLLQQHGDITQMQTANYQRDSYNKSLTEYVKKGEQAFMMDQNNPQAEWDKQFNTSTDEQVKKAYEAGLLDNTGPAVVNKFNKTETKINGEVVKATSETDAALIEMMKAEGIDLAAMGGDGFVIDATNGGAEKITIDATQK